MELIKLEMTPKERALAYARGEEVDRIPTSLSASETAPPLYGIPICDYYFSADAMVEVETRLAEDFQADNMGIGLGLRTLVEALGTELAYPKESVSILYCETSIGVFTGCGKHGTGECGKGRTFSADHRSV